jgi:hypothetical protein
MPDSLQRQSDSLLLDLKNSSSSILLESQATSPFGHEKIGGILIEAVSCFYNPNFYIQYVS